MTAIGAPIHLFQQSVTIQRRSDSLTNGSPSLSWANHLTNVPCMIQQTGGSEADVYASNRNRRQYTVLTSVGQDIVAKDRVLFTDSTSGSNVSRTFDIQSVRVNSFTRSSVLELLCEETD